MDKVENGVTLRRDGTHEPICFKATELFNREEKIWKYDITKANGAFEVEERNVESQPGSGVTVNYYTLKAKS